MSCSTSHLHQSLSLMSLEFLCAHLRRTKCGSDYQQAFHSSFRNMRIPYHSHWWKWMVPCVVIPQKRHPHPRMTSVYIDRECIECVQAHKVYLCKACTFSGWLPRKGATLRFLYHKDVSWCTWSLSWIRDQRYLETQDCCRSRSKDALCLLGIPKLPFRRAPP